MTRRDSHAPSGVDLEKTRRRFVLGRAQAASHAATADYLRIRDMGRAAGATTSKTAQSSSGTT
jgi:hypothetical protein